MSSRSNSPTPPSTRHWRGRLRGAVVPLAGPLDIVDDNVGGEDAQVSCVHPGWPVLNGRGEVLRSYALIMANTEYIQFFLTDVHVSVGGDTALVTCTENILSGGPAPDDSDELGPLVGQLVVATNVFRRTDDGWKLWSHHASPSSPNPARRRTRRHPVEWAGRPAEPRSGWNHEPPGMGGFRPMSPAFPRGNTR